MNKGEASVYSVASFIFLTDLLASAPSAVHFKYKRYSKEL